MKWGVVLIPLLAACASSESVVCGNGIVCPQGTTCRELTEPAEMVCATLEQVSACEGVANGEVCGEAGYCHDGVCLPIVCGNGRRDRGEACDDGNTVTGDGTCSGDCTSDETCGNERVDPLRLVDGRPELNESCDDGNRISGDGCASNCTIETPLWEEVSLAQPPPSFGAAMSYDIARRRVVMFGGGFDPVNDAVKRARGATYEWDGHAWIGVPTAVAPAPRWGAAFAYDSRRHRHVLFGGQESVIQLDSLAFGFNDTWEWDGSQWRLRVLEHPPVGRVGTAMAFDSRRGVMVLFGGRTQISAGGSLADTWEFDGVDWKQITTARTPDARAFHAMGYDPKRGVIVMAGGAGGTFAAPTELRETWEYDGTNWVEGAPLPVSLRNTQLAFDAPNARLIAYGADDSYTKTLAYNGSWEELSTATTPGILHAPSLAADPISGTVLLFGGSTSQTTQSAETWTWTGSNWSGPAIAPELPVTTLRASAAYDPTRGTMWMFGRDQLWSFDGTAWRKSTSPAPPGRIEHMLAYDAARDELVLYGGNDAGGDELTSTETWLYDVAGDTWRSVATTPAPPLRTNGVMAYDTARARTVLHAGLLSAGSNTPDDFLGDVWEWDGSQWTEVIPSGMEPPVRVLGTATYHPGLGVLVENGYYVADQLDIVLTSDLWSWDGTAWTNLSPMSPVNARAYGSLVYLGGLDRSFHFGGLRLGGNPLADTWAYDGAAWTPSLAIAPTARGAHISFPGRNGSDLMVFGGMPRMSTQNPVYYSDLQRYRYQNDAPRELCTLDIDNDGDGLPGCLDPDCWATCTPLCPPHTSCPADAPSCGDGVCNTALENCRICASDCDCPAVCGDSFCDAGESAASCPGDCP